MDQRILKLSMLWFALWRHLFRPRYRPSPFCQAGNEPAPMMTLLATYDGILGVPIFVTPPSPSGNARDLVKEIFLRELLAHPVGGPPSMTGINFYPTMASFLCHVNVLIADVSFPTAETDWIRRMLVWMLH